MRDLKRLSFTDDDPSMTAAAIGDEPVDDAENGLMFFSFSFPSNFFLLDDEHDNQ